MRGWRAAPLCAARAAAVLIVTLLCCMPLLAHAAGPARGAREKGGARVFDLSAAEHRGGVGLARTWARRTDRQRYRPGFELRATDVLRWTRGAIVVEGRFGAGVRWGPAQLSGSLLQNGGMAGVELGPLDVKAGVSTSMLNLGLTSGKFDVGFSWPRASLGVGLELGFARLEALAHVEYAWGWLGPDAYVRGIGLVLSLPRAPIGPDFQRAEPAAP